MADEGGSQPTGRERSTAIGFSPRRVAAGGGSRATIVAATTVGLVALAILKPWAAPGPAPSGAANASRPAAPTPGVLATQSVIDARRLPRREAVERAIDVHDEWGIRLVVEGPGAGGQLEELWQPAAPAQTGSIPSLSGEIGNLPVFAVAEERLRLVGLTAPPDAVVDAVSLVVGRPLGRGATLEVTTVAHRNGGSRSILVRLRDGSPWPPGVYQFRFKLGGERAALTFAVMDGPARR